MNRIPGFADLAYEKYLQATIEGFSLYESSYRDLQPYVDAMRAYASGPAKYNRSKHPSLDSYIRSNPPQAGSNESTVSAGTSLAELDTKQPVVQPEINSGGTSSMADRQTNSGPTEGESRPM